MLLLLIAGGLLEGCLFVGSALVGIFGNLTSMSPKTESKQAFGYTAIAIQVVLFIAYALAKAFKKN